MDPDYLLAEIPKPYRVLGLKLLPLSLGHCLILEQAKNGFLSDPRGTQVEDLIIAVLVCSMRFEQALEFFESPKKDKILIKWLKRLGKLKLVELQERFGLFMEYWLEGVFVPHFLVIGGESSGKSAPAFSSWIGRLKVSMMADFGMSETEALNRPAARCWWDYLTLEEMRGKVQILTKEGEDFEADLFRQADELQKSLDGAIAAN